MKLFNKTKRSGFTLLELLVTIAIVAVLAAIAIPTYLDYLNRGKFAEGVQVADQLRNYVAEYYQNNNGSFPADNASAGASPSGDYSAGNVASASIAGNVITVTYTLTDGVTPYDYTLTAAANAAGNLQWTAGGSVCSKIQC